MAGLKNLLKGYFNTSPQKKKSEAGKVPQMPAKETLEKEFEDFLKNLSMPASTIDKMRAMSDDNKWLMITESKRMAEGDTPDMWVNSLKKPASVNTLRKFRATLISADVKWLKEFAEKNGPALLTKANMASSNWEVKEACLLCVKAFMNSEFGLSAVMESAEIFAPFTHALASGKEQVLAIAFDIFAVVTWVSDVGYKMVTQVLENAKTEHNFKTIYSPAVKSLKNKGVSLKAKTSAMTFLNANVNSIDELEERAFMRGYLLDEGIVEVIGGLRKATKTKDTAMDEGTLLLNQFDLFEKEYEKDKRETELTDVDLNDPDSLWNCLLARARETGQSAVMLDLLKYILIIPKLRRLSTFIWRNCACALKIGTAFIINDKDLAELESSLAQEPAEPDLNATLKKAFTKSARLLKTTEVERLMQKAVGTNLAAVSSAADENSSEQIRSEFHNYRMAKEAEIDELRKKLAAAPTDAGGATLAPPSSEAGGDDMLLAPPSSEAGGDDMLLAPPSAEGAGDDFLLPPPPAEGEGDFLLPPPMAGGDDGMFLAPPMGGERAKPHLPARPNPAPGVKMKNLFWDMLPVDQIKGSVWDDIKDDAVVLDVGEFESLFQAKVAAARPAGGRGDASAKVAKERVQLVDAKRSTNVEIALSRFKMTPEAIRDAILALDRAVLDQEQTQKLLALVPSPEEAEVCSSYDGDLAELGAAERFFRVMAEIPAITARLENYLFMLQFEETFDRIMADIGTVLSSAEAIRSNKNLAKILSLVLKLGNHMNGGSKKGGAYGFKMSALKQLGSTKSTDNKISLMHYLVDYCAKQYPGVESIVPELAMLEAACRIEAQNLGAKVNTMKGNINKIKNMLKKQSPNAKDRYNAVMEPFYNSAAEKAAAMHSRMVEAQKSTEELITKFGENSKMMQWEEFFSIFNDFVQDFESSIDFWKRKKETEEKEKKRELFIKENKERMSSRRINSPTPKEGASDNVLKNLKNAHAGEIAEQILRRRQKAEAA